MNSLLLKKGNDLMYVKNAELTVEYILARAKRLGATNITSHDDGSFTMTWGNNPPMTWGKEFRNNLVSFRRQIENQGYYLKNNL
jgi:hypothetical protein